MDGPILHLFGSPSSAFWDELSCLYARGASDALEVHERFLHCHVAPDGSWAFPVGPHPVAIANAPRMSVGEAATHIVAAAPRCALPQMFCHAGMTDLRGFVEALGIPLIGNRPEVMAICADKVWAKAIVAQAGVATPAAQVVTRGELVDAAFPAVVKPALADNSEGIALVSDAAQLDAALDEAFAHGSRVLVEDFVPLGREVRCGVVEQGDRPVALPLEEYRVDPQDRPIRRAQDKLAPDTTGKLALQAKTDSESWIVAADDPVIPAVHEAAIACHRALGCRDYSLFDFRIDPAGKPWFLEAGPYCSFAPDSVLTTMVAAAGTPLPEFLAQMADRAIARHPRPKGHADGHQAA